MKRRALQQHGKCSSQQQAPCLHGTLAEMSVPATALEFPNLITQASTNQAQTKQLPRSHGIGRIDGLRSAVAGVWGVGCGMQVRRHAFIWASFCALWRLSGPPQPLRLQGGAATAAGDSTMTAAPWGKYLAARLAFVLARLAGSCSTGLLQAGREQAPPPPPLTLPPQPLFRALLVELLVGLAVAAPPPRRQAAALVTWLELPAAGPPLLVRGELLPLTGAGVLLPDATLTRNSAEPGAALLPLPSASAAGGLRGSGPGLHLTGAPSRRSSSATCW